VPIRRREMLRKTTLAIPLVISLLVGCGSNGSGGRQFTGQTTAVFPVFGSNGNDTIVGTPQVDIINGLGGNDVISGLASDDFLDGGTGDDTLSGGDGDDILTGGPGADALDGGNGDDTASYSGSSTAVTVDLGAGTGSSGDAAGDTLANVENLVGSNGDDVLTGDANNNIIEGGAGADNMDGGGGRDTISYKSSPAAVDVDITTDTVSGGDATGDTITGFIDVIGSRFADTITTGGFFAVAQGGAGSDTFIADIDSLFLDYENSPAGVTFNASTGAASGGDAEGDVITADTVYGVNGSEFNDNLSLSDLTSFTALIGNGGDDILNGSTGDDFFDGGPGNDIINGGGGFDTIEGGLGNDTVNAGGGDDDINYGQEDVILDFGTGTGFEFLQMFTDATFATGPQVRGADFIVVPETTEINPITIIITPADIAAPFSPNGEILLLSRGFVTPSDVTLIGAGWTNGGLINIFGIDFIQFTGMANGNPVFLNVSTAIANTAGLVP
jgi:Ca2+-binding RTX toxin-like protein